MTTIMQSQIFFFISSIGFIILWILSAFILAYILKDLNSLSKILVRAEKDINSIGGTTKEMIEEIQDSNLFRFLFIGKRRKAKEARTINSSIKTLTDVKSYPEDKIK